MYAIIKTGGKQLKVEEGRYYDMELLSAQVGEKLQFECLLLNDGKKTFIGAPLVKNAVVEGEIVTHGKGEKLNIFTYTPKKRTRRRMGHRQPFTRVKILSISK